ncbi:ribosome-associated translation inhibitor RaiA [soil metagenome]
MKIKFQSPDFTASQELTDFVKNKVEKLKHLYHEIIWSEVCLKLDNSETKENKACEIRLAIPGNDLLAGAQCKTFEEAAAQCVEALEKQIKKRKTKIIAKRKDIVEIKNS